MSGPFAIGNSIVVLDKAGRSVPVAFCDKPERAKELATDYESRMKLVAALQFYADPKRYEGSNQRRDSGDPYTPEEMPYRLDVYRDSGEIARAALAAAGVES
jgi:hypothetical protein